MSHNHDFGFREYLTPHCQADPKREILLREWADYKHKRKQGKFKTTTKPITCYFDELIQPIKDHPAAPRYNIAKDILPRSESASLKKILVDQNYKKETYLDRLE